MENEPYYCKICGIKLVPGAKFCSKCGTSVEVGVTDNTPVTRLRPFHAGFFMRERILKLTERFRTKGAISPETAMTASELGLGPRFERAMDRRLGRAGVFVKIDGKYYLSEERLKEARDRLSARR
ncbi:MAG: zinc ribbon domain-containing protein [Promethearchaeati archaeon SRVP18_Atabeyarchaeia-1]